MATIKRSGRGPVKHLPAGITVRGWSRGAGHVTNTGAPKHRTIGQQTRNNTFRKLALCKPGARAQRVRLDSGGYDSRGEYFGGGRGTAPLYNVELADGSEHRVRAADSKGAIRKVCLARIYPQDFGGCPTRSKKGSSR